MKKINKLLCLLAVILCFASVISVTSVFDSFKVRLFESDEKETLSVDQPVRLKFPIAHKHLTAAGALVGFS